MFWLQGQLHIMILRYLCLKIVIKKTAGCCKNGVLVVCNLWHSHHNTYCAGRPKAFVGGWWPAQKAHVTRMVFSPVAPSQTI